MNEDHHAMHGTVEYFIAMLLIGIVMFQGAFALLQHPILKWVGYPIMLYFGLWIAVSVYNIFEMLYMRFYKK